MIKGIEIKNFRGVSEGKIDDFDNLNIFVGKNNCGKSTVLDALAILISPKKLTMIVERRGWYGLDSVKSIFRYRNMENPIEIIGNGIQVKIKRSGYSIEERTIGDRMILLTVSYLKNGKMEYEYNVKFNPDERNIGSLPYKDGKEEPDIIILDHNIIHGVGLGEAYSKVFDKGFEAHQELLDVINQVYPDVIDIRLFSEKIGPEVIYKTGKVPIYAMGDGFKSAYITLAFLSGIENGYILCEEPENYQHPSSRDLVVKGICEAAKNNQIFISTHSLEFIDVLLSNVNNINVKFFSLELDQNSGKLSYYSFDSQSAIFRRKELEADLRR
ncbi:AAA ATPase domain protein [uncultured archaeon]|nr:AAA ATPase domain protein [uncultured archaeon]